MAGKAPITVVPGFCPVLMGINPWPDPETSCLETVAREAMGCPVLPCRGGPLLLGSSRQGPRGKAGQASRRDSSLSNKGTEIMYQKDVWSASSAQSGLLAKRICEGDPVGRQRPHLVPTTLRPGPGRTRNLPHRRARDRPARPGWPPMYSHVLT